MAGFDTPPLISNLCNNSEDGQKNKLSFFASRKFALFCLAHSWAAHQLRLFNCGLFQKSEEWELNDR
jgi:hypothetical protein